jgi:hypothetical protein
MSQEITTDSCPVSKLVRALELENEILRDEILQLHQAIAALNDKPTNSL